MRFRSLLIAAGLVTCLVSFGLAMSPASASPIPANTREAVSPPNLFHPPAAGNDLCFSCHIKEDFSVVLDGGETLMLTVNQEAFETSVHGTNGVLCASCHVDTPSFPHPKRTAQTLRDVTVNFSATCTQCHSEQSAQAMDSVHQKAFSEGNRNAAVCADCHDPHTQQPMRDPVSGKLRDDARMEVVNTCAKCHNTIYEVYEKSVHGAALTQEGNLDVPTCIDCHGVHNIQDPTTATFRNSTPYLCATCHTDPQLMGKYGLSTEVLNTYVADFHGTTVVLFDKEFPDQPTNKPVCTDCHGVHDIAKGDDPAKGLAVKENLLARCQKCHPDASANFPDAWLSHYIPTPEKYPFVYYVNLFYKFFIPGVLVPMAALVLMDFTRMMINRFRKVRPAPVTLPEAPPQPTTDAENIPTASGETQVEDKQQPPEEPATEETQPTAVPEAGVVDEEPTVPKEDAAGDPPDSKEKDVEEETSENESKNDTKESSND